MFICLIHCCMLDDLCRCLEYKLLKLYIISKLNKINKCGPLTYVWCDDGEGAEVGLPHVLCQRVCVFLKVAQQRRWAALSALDQLPVRSRVWRQDGAAHTDQILSEKKQRVFSVTGGHSREKGMKCYVSLQIQHERLRCLTGQGWLPVCRQNDVLSVSRFALKFSVSMYSPQWSGRPAWPWGWSPAGCTHAAAGPVSASRPLSRRSRSTGPCAGWRWPTWLLSVELVRSWGGMSYGKSSQTGGKNI